MESEIEIVEGRGHRKYGTPSDSPFAPSNFTSGVDLVRHVAENDGKDSDYHMYDGQHAPGAKVWAKKTIGKNGQIYWSDAIRHVEKPVFPSKEEIVENYPLRQRGSRIETWMAACEWMKERLDL